MSKITGMLTFGYMTISNTPKLRKILARDGQVGPGDPENKKLEHWRIRYF